MSLFRHRAWSNLIEAGLLPTLIIVQLTCNGAQDKKFSSLKHGTSYDRMQAKVTEEKYVADRWNDKEWNGIELTEQKRKTT